MKTIFVTIPSYEDPELIDTLDSAFENAAFPGKIHISVALQYKKVPMPDVNKYMKRPGIKFTYYDVDTRPGITQLRHNLSKLHDGEDYFLMIDSHTKFIKNWDLILIQEYEKIVSDSKNDKVIISQLASGFGIICDCYNTNSVCEKNHSVSYYSLANNFKEIFPDAESVFRISMIKKEDMVISATNYYVSGGASGQFFFTNKKWLEEVGIIDGVQFAGEEATLTFRSYISGWTFYGLKNIYCLLHNNINYNIVVYGKESPTKRYTKVRDYRVVLREVKKLLILNAGPFAIKKYKKTAEQFWKSLGISDLEYQLLVESFENSTY